MLPSEPPHIEIIKSPNRLHYRNRIQLHYHQKSSSLGFKEKGGRKILPVPHCMIMNKNVSEKYQWLLKNWKKEVTKKRLPPSGHVEIYDLNDVVQVSWNKPYADQGFSQVNSDTNEVMIKTLHDYFQTRSKNILDLFGGAGNLTNIFNQKMQNRLCIDLYPDKKRNEEFFHLNLFQENALEEFKTNKTNDFDTIFVDPPRSGFKDLPSWVNHFNPKYIAYISCHPATMIRDLKPIMGQYLTKKTYLIDLFPGTFHYEAMIFLEKA